METTIYLSNKAINKGIGMKLYSILIEQLKVLKFHILIGGIGLPNEASIALHEKLRFKKVAHFNEIGYKFNKWVAVSYWQLSV